MLFAGRALLQLVDQDNDIESLSILLPRIQGQYREQQDAIESLQGLVTALEEFAESLDELQVPSLTEQANQWSDWAKAQVESAQKQAHLEQQRSGTDG